MTWEVGFSYLALLYFRRGIGESCWLSTWTFECLIVNCIPFALCTDGAPTRRLGSRLGSRSLWPLANVLQRLGCVPSSRRWEAFPTRWTSPPFSFRLTSPSHRFFFLAKCSVAFCCRFWHDYANMRTVTFIDSSSAEPSQKICEKQTCSEPEKIQMPAKKTANVWRQFHFPLFC